MIVYIKYDETIVYICGHGYRYTACMGDLLELLFYWQDYHIHLLELRDAAGGCGRTVHTQAVTFCSDSYTVFSLGKDEDKCSLVAEKEEWRGYHLCEQRSEAACC